jgi:hypothetical protein
VTQQLIQQRNQFAGLFLFVIIAFPVYHFSSFICLQKFVMFADKKSEPTKDCGLFSLIATTDFILLALHIKKISI